MATTIDFSSDIDEYTDFYTGDGVALSEDYATLTFSWADMNGYPEVIVEQALSDSEYDDDWYPVYQQKATYEEPVKFRINTVAGKYSINLYPLLATTAYVRIRVNANNADEGTLEYDISVGS